jgi:hypothetical protein
MTLLRHSTQGIPLNAANFWAQSIPQLPVLSLKCRNSKIQWGGKDEEDELKQKVQNI